MDKDQSYDAMLCSYWNMQFKNAMVHKAPYTKRWTEYMNAYSGDYFKNESIPDYKSNFVSNYIFSVIETIRPIMVDQNPKFQATSRQPEGLQHSNDLHEALMYEWDRTRMNRILYRELITTLTVGTVPFFTPWDSEDKNVQPIPINPFNFFPDPLATSVDDAEYLIYAKYMPDALLKRKFPSKAQDIEGGAIKYGELVNNNDKNARIDNQVLTLEIWTRDYQRDEHIIDDVKHSKPRYPNGRVLILCPEINVVLSDKSNPYKDKRFPFLLLKDYDIPGKFWGEGEVAQLLSPQKYMNELNNAVIDNAKSTANMPWIVDKNAGIPHGKITNRPGLIIRKNPGTEVKRDQPPSMPNYVINAVETFKSDIEQISGIFNTVKGNSETGVYTAQGILALQEAGQARIRLKVKLLEDFLSELGTMWVSRMKQFWKEDRFIAVTKHDGTYDLKKFMINKLEYDYDVKVTAGSTMMVNRGAMLDLMIRLAQTQMPDGQPLVDREAVVQYLPEEVKSALLGRMQDKHVVLEELQQQVEQMTQQFTQALQQNEAQDKEVISVVEDVVKAVEGLKEQIVQLQGKHDKMMEEQKKQEEIDKIKSDSYNTGYADAEKLLSASEEPAPMGEIPDELLQGIDSMSDDELSLLIKQHPELVELINKQ